MLELGILAWVVMMALDRGSDKPYSKRGGGGTTIEQAPAPTPVPSASDTAADIYQARLKYDPLVQQMEYNLQQQYLPMYSQLYKDTQQNVFGNEGQVAEAYRQQALQGLTDPAAQMQQTLGLANQLQTGMNELNPNAVSLQDALQQQIMSSLTSPTGLTAEQTTAQDAIRQREMDRLTEAMRTRANLGGGLFGGRAAGTEQRAQSELGQAYAAEDIDRQERSRMQALANAMMMASQNQAYNQQLYGQAAGQQQNALAAAFPYMQTYYPGMGLTTPSFQSVVGSPDAYVNQASNIYGAQANMYNASLAAQAQQQAARSQMLGSLFSGLGQGIGTAAGTKYLPG